jgi:hypothetical protein
MVFAGSYDGNLYAVNATNGNLVWKFLTGDIVVSSPAVENGVIYFGSYDHLIYAIGTFQNPEKPNLMNVDPVLLFVSVFAAFAVIAAVTLAIVIIRKRHPNLFFKAK